MTALETDTPDTQDASDTPDMPDMPDDCRIDVLPRSTPEFDELVSAMADDLYWVRFFARPCCPAPDLEGACAMLDRLAGEVAARDDLTPPQRDELSSIIESRKEWYATSGLCRGSRAGRA